MIEETLHMHAFPGNFCPVSHMVNVFFAQRLRFATQRKRDRCVPLLRTSWAYITPFVRITCEPSSENEISWAQKARKAKQSSRTVITRNLAWPEA